MPIGPASGARALRIRVDRPEQPIEAQVAQGVRSDEAPYPLDGASRRDQTQEILAESYDDDIGDYEDVEIEEVPVIPEWMEDEIELALEIFIYEKERYTRIPERNPGYGYDTMKAFAETLEDVALRETLLELLDGKNAFRRFKDGLAPYPKERKLWYGFNAKASRNEIRAWLLSIGIDPDNVN